MAILILHLEHNVHNNSLYCLYQLYSYSHRFFHAKRNLVNYYF